MPTPEQEHLIATLPALLRILPEEDLKAFAELLDTKSGSVLSAANAVHIKAAHMSVTTAIAHTASLLGPDYGGDPLITPADNDTTMKHAAAAHVCCVAGIDHLKSVMESAGINPQATGAADQTNLPQSNLSNTLDATDPDAGGDGDSGKGGEVGAANLMPKPTNAAVADTPETKMPDPAADVELSPDEFKALFHETVMEEVNKARGRID
jgi:hypothetical protein